MQALAAKVASVKPPFHWYAAGYCFQNSQSRLLDPDNNRQSVIAWPIIVPGKFCILEASPLVTTTVAAVERQQKPILAQGS